MYSISHPVPPEFKYKLNKAEPAQFPFQDDFLRCTDLSLSCYIHETVILKYYLGPNVAGFF